MPADREDVINDIRAVLISTSGGISESSLSRDYRSLIGRDIPFRELGFSSLISFLRSVQGLRIIGGPAGCMIDAVPDAKTGHISSLVARTRTKKSKGSSRFRRGAPLRRAPPPRLPPTYQRTVPPRFAQQRVAERSNSYPEIIPQRQPLRSVQSRLNVGPSETSQTTSQIPPPSPSLSDSSSNSGLSPSSISSRPPSTDIRLDLPRARANIVTVSSGRGLDSADSRYKVSSSYADWELKENKSFVDIQWLRGPVFSSQGRLNNSPPTPNNVRTTAQPFHPAPSPPVFAPRMPVPVQMPTPSPQPVPVVQSAAYVPNKPRMRLVEQKANNNVSYVQELEVMSSRLGLGIPAYKEIERRPSNEKPVYIGVVKVGDLKFTSYPEELSSKDLAREFVARLAFENLRSRQTTYGSNAYDEFVIVERVKQIVGCKSNGLFNKAVEEAYKKNFGQDLPANWLDFLNTCNLLSVERYNEKNVIIYPNTRETIMPSVGSEVTNSSGSQQSEAKSITNGSSIQHFKATSITNGPSSQRCKATSVTNGSSIHQGDESSNDSCSVLPKLTYPSDNVWTVFITSASPNDIWLRLIGDEYDTMYNEALNDMEVKLMSSSGQTVSHPIVNHYYMVKFDNCWLRVQLLEILPASDSEATAEVFLIDNGEVDTIKLTDLRELDNFVRNVPAQAVQCRLACVDMLARPVQDFLLDSVIGNSLYASVIQRPTDDNDNVATIFLYEGSDDGSESTNINSVLCEKVISEIRAPRLPQKGNIAEMYVSHVEEGSVYVQLKSRNLDLLNLILDDISLRDLIQEFGLNAHPSIRHMDNPDGGMFLVHSRKAPNKWRRGIIVGVENHLPNVYFVDYGYTENVMVSDMFDLEKVFSPLCNFPLQAIKVELSQIPSNDLVGGVIGRVKELAPPTLPLLGKVTDADRPSVELFKRIQPDNIIVSINTDLSFNLAELQSAPFIDKEAKAPEVQRVDALLKIGTSKQCSSSPVVSASPSVTSPSVARPCIANGTKEKQAPTAPIPLEPFAVPEGEEFFDVLVTMSPNPSHFIVQPLNIVNSTFHAMMQEMEQFYSSQKSGTPVPSDDDLVEGAAFAAKHPDDLQWYRVKLLAKINSSVVTVHYLDYGDVGVINVDRIRFLDPRFRILQCLAIRAKLHGVLPKNGDWSVAECLTFSEMVNNRPFVSKIMSKNPDSSSNEWEVSLQLFDTSGDIDVNVAEKLIGEGLAARA